VNDEYFCANEKARSKQNSEDCDHVYQKIEFQVDEFPLFVVAVGFSVVIERICFDFSHLDFTDINNRGDDSAADEACK
jgi:hypothetical protein